jgi:hypothetical protein
LQCENMLDFNAFTCNGFWQIQNSCDLNVWWTNIPWHSLVKVGLVLICDVEVFLGLTCIIPMMELV